MGVPTHRLEIRKNAFGHSWANDWLIESPSMDDAETASNALIDFEMALHYNVVHFDTARLSTMSIGDRSFRHIAINAFAEGVASLGTFLPLYCTLRLDMSTVDSDPCRKYFRAPIPEAQQADGVLSSAIVDPVGPAFLSALALFPDGTSVVSNIGHIVINGSANNLVQMRQLHRHKRKKIIP